MLAFTRSRAASSRYFPIDKKTDNPETSPLKEHPLCLHKNPQMPSDLVFQTRSRRWVTSATFLKSLFEGMSAASDILVSRETVIGSKQLKTVTYIAGCLTYFYYNASGTESKPCRTEVSCQYSQLLPRIDRSFNPVWMDPACLRNRQRLPAPDVCLSLRRLE